MHSFIAGGPSAGPDAGGAAQKNAADLLVNIEPLLVTRPDAARLLSVSLRKLDMWVALGLVPKWKLDRVVRFAVDDLRAFVQMNKVKQSSPALLDPMGNGVQEQPEEGQGDAT